MYMQRRSCWCILTLHSGPSFHICGEACDGIEATESVLRLRPDIVRTDVDTPRMNGSEATRVIQREAPGRNVILVTQNDPMIAREHARVVDANGAVTILSTIYCQQSKEWQ
jgi:chemotaxis response regulator CheB